jgi:hypothetical protein
MGTTFVLSVCENENASLPMFLNFKHPHCPKWTRSTTHVVVFVIQHFTRGADFINLGTQSDVKL